MCVCLESVSVPYTVCCVSAAQRVQFPCEPSVSLEECFHSKEVVSPVRLQWRMFGFPRLVSNVATTPQTPRLALSVCVCVIKHSSH